MKRSHFFIGISIRANALSSDLLHSAHFEHLSIPCWSASAVLKRRIFSSEARVSFLCAIAPSNIFESFCRGSTSTYVVGRSFACIAPYPVIETSLGAPIRALQIAAESTKSLPSFHCKTSDALTDVSSQCSMTTVWIVHGSFGIFSLAWSGPLPSCYLKMTWTSTLVLHPRCLSSTLISPKTIL